MRGDICTYFFESPDKLGVGYLFGEHVVCDNFDCSSNCGKFFSAQIDCYTGFCKTNAAKNAELEKKLDEINMKILAKAYQGIKPINLKTGKPYER